MAVTLLALVGCSPPVDGRPVVGPKDVDQGYFFAGDVAVYGQRVDPDDTTLLAYFRALRRIDVCGLLTGAALAKVGETLSVGTIFAFDECDAELKVSGDTARRFVSAELGMSPTPVGSCDVSIPLELERLPGARPLTASSQPVVRVGLIGPENCELIRRIADAIATRLATAPLPARDAAATYWSRLAERDPCEVLSVLPDPVADWDVPGSGPYTCRFSVIRAERTVSLQVRLEPQLVEAATEGRVRIDQQGAEVYMDPVFCSAVSFVDAPLERKVIGRGYLALADVVIRPAVVVDTEGRDCDSDEPLARRAEDLVLDVATEAARLYR
jgi:hypothetical protein